MGFLGDWFRSSREIVRRPSAFFDRATLDDNGHAVRFAFVSTAVAWALMLIAGIPLGAGLFTGAEGVLLILALVSISLSLMWVNLGTYGYFLMAMLIHPLIYLFGRRDYWKTANVLAYSSPVMAFFGWIAVLNLLALPYLFYVQIRGIASAHRLPTWKAAVAVLVPALGITILITGVVLGAVFYAVLTV